MNNNILIETREIGNHRIKIYYDTDAECPVTNWDMGAKYIFEHLERGSYWLSSDCDWKEWVSDYRGYSMEDILREMAAEVVEQSAIIDYYKAGKVDNLRFVYNSHSHLWELQTRSTLKDENSEWITESEFEPSDLKACDCRMELLECLDKEELVALIDKCAKDFVIKEWGSTGYSQGDYIRGIAYMTKERFDKYCGFNQDKYKNWKEQALAIIDAEVETIGMWAWGDVKGYVLEEKVPYTKHFQDSNRDDEEEFDWDEIDSCWGYFMETEKLIDEVIAEHGLKEAV